MAERASSNAATSVGRSIPHPERQNWWGLQYPHPHTPLASPAEEAPLCLTSREGLSCLTSREGGCGGSSPLRPCQRTSVPRQQHPSCLTSRGRTSLASPAERNGRLEAVPTEHNSRTTSVPRQQRPLASPAEEDLTSGSRHRREHRNDLSLIISARPLQEVKTIATEERIVDVGWQDQHLYPSTAAVTPLSTFTGGRKEPRGKGPSGQHPGGLILSCSSVDSLPTMEDHGKEFTEKRPRRRMRIILTHGVHVSNTPLASPAEEGAAREKRAPCHRRRSMRGRRFHLVVARSGVKPLPLSTCAEVTSNHATPEEHVNVQHRCTTSGTQLPRNLIRSWMPEGGGCARMASCRFREIRGSIEIFRPRNSKLDR